MPRQQEKEVCNEIPREECVQVPRQVAVQVPEQVRHIAPNSPCLSSLFSSCPPVPGVRAGGQAGSQADLQAGGAAGVLQHPQGGAEAGVSTGAHNHHHLSPLGIYEHSNNPRLGCPGRVQECAAPGGEARVLQCAPATVRKCSKTGDVKHQ